MCIFHLSLSNMEKSRFNEKFSLCRVFCLNLKRTCCLDLFFCLKNAFALQYRFAMANHLACFGNEKTSPRKAELLGVTQRTIFNILCGFRINGNVLPCRIGRPNVMASIARDEAFLLMEYIMRHPGAYLREAVHYLENICGRELSLSSVRCCFARRDFTRKKVRQR